VVSVEVQKRIPILIPHPSPVRQERVHQLYIKSTLGENIPLVYVWRASSPPSKRKG